MRQRSRARGLCSLSILCALLAFPALALPGCGDDGGAGPDAGPDTGPDAAPGSAPDAGGAPDAAPGSAPDAGDGAPLACADLPLCDGFEGAAAGAPPPAPWAVVAPNCSNGGTVAVDDQVAHSGSRSVRVTAGGSYCDHVFLADDDVIATLGPVIHGRFFVRLDAALGDGHTTFLAMRDQGESRDLRMGGQSRILMWNRESDDATLPALSPAGTAQSVALPAQTWRCVEFAVNGPAGTIETWVDGARVAGLVVDGEATPDIDEPWLRKAGWAPSLSDFKLGWEAYAGQANTLWFDDVALASAPIGCGG
jgi:hypothetical protein